MDRNLQTEKPSIIAMNEAYDKLNLFIARFRELIAAANATENPTEIGQLARDIASQSNNIFNAANQIAITASIKEQHDYAIEQHAQKTENFAAALQSRKPSQIGKHNKK